MITPTIPFLGISLLLIGKVFMMFALTLYLIFALVIIRQVALMTQTLDVGFEVPIKLLTYIHLGFAIVVFILALIIL